MRSPRFAIQVAAVYISFAASTALAVSQGVQPVTTPFIRAVNALNHMRIDPKGRLLAYEGDDGQGLFVIDLKTRNIFAVTKAQVGASFVWAPDGVRLMYREQVSTANGGVHSKLRAYDTALAQNITLDDMPFATGLLTFDPRDLRLQLLSPQGIRTKRIYFPGERLAKWQVAQRTETGKWLATQQGILWVTQGGFAMRRLDDDASGIDSFDISSDGESLAWATKAGRVYRSKTGHPPVLLGFGRDPRWHPNKDLLIYAGARMVGANVIGYDLRLADAFGAGKFLTATQFSDERWPQWHPKGKQVMYTIAKTTDIYLLDFVP